MKPSIVRTKLPNKDYGANPSTNTSINREKKLIGILSGAKVKVDHTANYDVIETYDPIHDVTSFKVSSKEKEQE